MTTKICARCGKEQLVSQFGKRKQLKDGLSSYCRQCWKEINEARKESLRANHAEYRKKNSEKVKLFWKNYWEIHRERILARKRQQYREAKGLENSPPLRTHRLSKSAFKIGRSCPTKLFYYRSKYPSTLNDNPYLEFLADGGHIVGKLAQMCFPGGILIESGGDMEQAVAHTAQELQKENVTLYEAAIQAGNKLALVDILEKRGRSVRLIEVKSKSYDSEKEEELRSQGKRSTFINVRGEVDSDWRPYLEDIAFQGYVFSLSYPQLEWIPYLYLPDKSKTTKIDGLASLFSIVESENAYGNKKHFTVMFNGDEDLEKAVAQDSFMTLVNVEEEVEMLWDEVRESAEYLDQSLTPSLTKIAPSLGPHCSRCEYRVRGGEKSGFLECWGAKGEKDPHIFDLYYGTTIQAGELFESLIRTNQTSLFDVPTEILSKKRGARQLIQILHTKSATEWFSSDLASIIRGVQYPLHFVDFETSRVAVPYHANMRPYEQVAFQWSCHTVASPGASPKHFEWINTHDRFPNFEFARSLKAQVGDSGTVLTWAHHETSVLEDIAQQMKTYGAPDAELSEWISCMTDADNGRILDLNRVTLEHYFHPAMKGRTSLKAVLPAVWNSYPDLHEIPWVSKYLQYEDGKLVLDPYKTLSKIEIAGKAESVREGTGAMRAYQDMVYGQKRDDSEEEKEQWKKLLLQYCELDTIAMVVVWTYWERRLGLQQGRHRTSEVELSAR